MRIIGWRNRLQEALNNLRNQPFAWGTNDCLVGLAGSCVEAVIGEDVVKEHRGKYDSVSSAVVYLRSLDFKSLADAVASHFSEVPASQAWVGDIAVLPGDQTGTALGVFLGERIAVLTRDGYGTISRSQAIAAYRVE